MISKTKNKSTTRARRHGRIRARVHGTADRPRLSVFRSNKFIYAQIINDDLGKTLVSATDMKSAKGKSEPASKKMERAEKIGKAIADSAKIANIKKVVFDRGGFTYTGRVKALADSARANGLEF